MFPFNSKPKIAIIELHGVIGNNIKETDYSRLLEEIRTDSDIGALILDIDSPGGGSGDSDLLYENVRRVANKKPVVAYIRGLGASGGYYIACGANTIMASRGSLVGSIGVIYLRPIMQQLLGKVGVEFSVFKAGRLKDMTAFWRNPTEEESDKFQNLTSQVYDMFVAVVALGRNMNESLVRELATGEVYTAKQAQEFGLIDSQGTIHDAIDVAVKLSGGRRKTRHYRPKRPLFNRLGLGRQSLSIRLGLENLAMLTSGGIYLLEPGMLGRYIYHHE